MIFVTFSIVRKKKKIVFYSYIFSFLWISCVCLSFASNPEHLLRASGRLWIAYDYAKCQLKLSLWPADIKIIIIQQKKKLWNSYRHVIAHHHMVLIIIHTLHTGDRKRNYFLYWIFHSFCYWFIVRIPPTKRTHAVPYNDKGSNYNCLWYFFSRAKRMVQHQFMRIIHKKIPSEQTQKKQQNIWKFIWTWLEHSTRFLNNVSIFFRSCFFASIVKSERKWWIFIR